MSDTEKITINLSVVDLGKVDLLVDQGFYSNRSDLIRTAIRNQLTTHATVVDETVVRRGIDLGIWDYNRASLERKRAKGERLNLWALGGVVISNDVTPELALETIESIKTYGVFRASREVKEALGDRIK